MKIRNRTRRRRRGEGGRELGRIVYGISYSIPKRGMTAFALHSSAGKPESLLSQKPSNTRIGDQCNIHIFSELSQIKCTFEGM